MLFRSAPADSYIFLLSGMMRKYFKSLEKPFLYGSLYVRVIVYEAVNVFMSVCTTGLDLLMSDVRLRKEDAYLECKVILFKENSSL